MGKVHVVAKGDHLPRIAAAHGFLQHETILEDPQNAKLKQRRDPCVLQPGDQVFIPDKQVRPASVSSGEKHAFVVKRNKLLLRIAFRDASGKPLADVPFTLTTPAGKFDLRSDPDGQIEQEIAVDTEACTVAFLDTEMKLLVGHLTPVEEPAGQRARLNNLGYEAGDDTGPDADTPAADDPVLRSALEELQCDSGLPVTGVCDDATQAALLEQHGS